MGEPFLYTSKQAISLANNQVTPLIGNNIASNSQTLYFLNTLHWPLTFEGDRMVTFIPVLVYLLAHILF